MTYGCSKKIYKKYSILIKYVVDFNLCRPRSGVLRESKTVNGDSSYGPRVVSSAGSTNCVRPRVASELQHKRLCGAVQPWISGGCGLLQLPTWKWVRWTTEIRRNQVDHWPAIINNLIRKHIDFIFRRV